MKKSEFSLAGKDALVTGGGSGIGRSISLKFAAHGCRVHILERFMEKAEETCKEINAKGGAAISYECDVSNLQEVAKIISLISSEHNIDILVNNAGIAHIGNIEKTTEEDLDRVYQVNIKGVYNCTRAVIPFMKEKAQGVILNMASIASVVGIKDRFAYSMSKGAVLTMTYSIAKDYLDYKIRCNCISPARVHTPFVDEFLEKNYPNEVEKKFMELSKSQPMGRMGEPEEVANLALYLCSDEAAFITGTNFPIDGGFIKLNG